MANTRPSLPDSDLADEFKSGMSLLASGVSLITTMRDGAPYGLVATSVSSVCADPPTLMICVNESASAHDPIVQSGIFCVNLLSQQDYDIASQFSSSKLRPQRFKSGDWKTLSSDAPCLATAQAAFDCRVTQKLQYGTHTILLGAVIAVATNKEQYEPLIYAQRGYRSLNACVVC